jgi:hypothetical protein
MKYGIRVCTEDNPKGAVLVTPITEDRVLFDTYEQAYSHAMKLREKSSIGVYYKIERVDGGER